MNNIDTNPNQIFIVPLYSYTCPCDFLHYIVWDRKEYWTPTYHINGNKMFHHKYLNKFKNLREQKTKYDDFFKLIPHFPMVEQAHCEHISVCEADEPYSGSTLFSQFTLYKRCQSLDQDVLSNLKKLEYFKFGIDIGIFINDYWLTANYGWYSGYPPKWGLTFYQKKTYLQSTSETGMLTILEGNIYRLESEIKSSLPIPFDLTKIIYSYSYSAADIFCKIISIVHNDILKFGKIIASDYIA